MVIILFLIMVSGLGAQQFNPEYYISNGKYEDGIREYLRGNVHAGQISGNERNKLLNGLMQLYHKESEVYQALFENSVLFAKEKYSGSNNARVKYLYAISLFENGEYNAAADVLEALGSSEFATLYLSSAKAMSLNKDRFILNDINQAVMPAGAGIEQRLCRQYLLFKMGLGSKCTGEIVSGLKETNKNFPYLLMNAALMSDHNTIMTLLQKVLQPESPFLVKLIDKKKYADPTVLYSVMIASRYMSFFYANMLNDSYKNADKAYETQYYRGLYYLEKRDIANCIVAASATASQFKPSLLCLCHLIKGNVDSAMIFFNGMRSSKNNYLPFARFILACMNFNRPVLTASMVDSAKYILSRIFLATNPNLHEMYGLAFAGIFVKEQNYKLAYEYFGKTYDNRYFDSLEKNSPLLRVNYAGMLGIIGRVDDNTGNILLPLSGVFSGVNAIYILLNN